MKKILLTLLALSLVLAMSVFFVACDENKEDTETKTPETENVENNQNEELHEEDEKEEEPVVPVVPDEIAIDEQVIFDNGTIVVTAKGLTENILFGDALKLLIENNGTTDVNVSVDKLIVNGFMSSGYCYEDVAAGKKVNTELYLLLDDLEDFGIKTLGLIELVIGVNDIETNETLESSELVSIKTNAYDVMDTEITAEGVELYNANGVKFVSLGIEEDELLGTSIYIYAENTSEANVLLDVENFSVNGFMVDPLLMTSVDAGRKAVDMISIYSEDLETNGIEKIENVEFVLEISDDDTWDVIAVSDVISLSVE